MGCRNTENLRCLPTALWCGMHLMDIAGDICGCHAWNRVEPCRASEIWFHSDLLSQQYDNAVFDTNEFGNIWVLQWVCMRAMDNSTVIREAVHRVCVHCAGLHTYLPIPCCVRWCKHCVCAGCVRMRYTRVWTSWMMKPYIRVESGPCIVYWPGYNWCRSPGLLV